MLFEFSRYMQLSKVLLKVVKVPFIQQLLTTGEKRNSLPIAQRVIEGVGRGASRGVSRVKEVKNYRSRKGCLVHMKLIWVC